MCAGDVGRNSGAPRIQRAPGSPRGAAPRSLARAALATARRARFSACSACRARRSLEGRRSARSRARSALATSRPARLTARSSRTLATSARRRRRQTRNLEASGQTNHASAPAPARRNAPRFPCSAPYHAPTTTRGIVAACRIHRPVFKAWRLRPPLRTRSEDARGPSFRFHPLVLDAFVLADAANRSRHRVASEGDRRRRTHSIFVHRRRTPNGKGRRALSRGRSSFPASAWLTRDGRATGSRAPGSLTSRPEGWTVARYVLLV